MARTFGEMEKDDYAKEQSWFERQTPWSLFWKVLGVVVALTVVFGTLGFVFGWFNTAKDVVSPQNVRAQWEFAYTYNNSLEASARNWCSAKQAETKAIGDDAKNERMSQTSAREANYESIRAKYDAALQNAFKAKLVAPPDVPTRAPTLEEEVKALSLTCQ